MADKAAAAFDQDGSAELKQLILDINNTIKQLKPPKDHNLEVPFLNYLSENAYDAIMRRMPKELMDHTYSSDDLETARIIYKALQIDPLLAGYLLAASADGVDNDFIFSSKQNRTLHEMQNMLQFVETIHSASNLRDQDLAILQKLFVFKKSDIIGAVFMDHSNMAEQLLAADTLQERSRVLESFSLLAKAASYLAASQESGHLDAVNFTVNGYFSSVLMQFIDHTVPESHQEMLKFMVKEANGRYVIPSLVSVILAAAIPEDSKAQLISKIAILANQVHAFSYESNEEFSLFYISPKLHPALNLLNITEVDEDAFFTSRDYVQQLQNQLEAALRDPKLKAFTSIINQELKLCRKIFEIGTLDLFESLNTAKPRAAVIMPIVAYPKTSLLNREQGNRAFLQTIYDVLSAIRPQPSKVTIVYRNESDKLLIQDLFNTGSSDIQFENITEQLRVFKNDEDSSSQFDTKRTLLITMPQNAEEYKMVQQKTQDTLIQVYDAIELANLGYVLTKNPEDPIHIQTQINLKTKIADKKGGLKPFIELLDGLEDALNNHDAEAAPRYLSVIKSYLASKPNFIYSISSDKGVLVDIVLAFHKNQAASKWLCSALKDDSNVRNALPYGTIVMLDLAFSHTEYLAKKILNTSSKKSANIWRNVRSMIPSIADISNLKEKHEYIANLFSNLKSTYSELARHIAAATNNEDLTAAFNKDYEPLSNNIKKLKKIGTSPSYAFSALSSAAAADKPLQNLIKDFNYQMQLISSVAAIKVYDASPIRRFLQWLHLRPRQRLIDVNIFNKEVSQLRTYISTENICRSSDTSTTSII